MELFLFKDYLLPPKDSDVLLSLSNNVLRTVRMEDNVYGKYLIIGNMPPIKRTAFIYCFLFYNIEDVGLIPIWYKSHKIIHKIYKKEKKKFRARNKIQTNLNKRQKLGL